MGPRAGPRSIPLPAVQDMEAQPLLQKRSVAAGKAPHPASQASAIVVVAEAVPLLLCLGVLGAVELGSSLAWQPQLGGRWPTGMVINSPLYGFPHRGSETVPYTWFLIVSAAVTAVCSASLEKLHGGPDQIRRGVIVFCGCWESWGWTALLTQLGKVYIAEPRPDFRDRCWPGQDDPSPEECSAALSASQLADQLKSFPSGHASTAAAIGVFLSGYALWTIYSRPPPPAAQSLRQDSGGAPPPAPAPLLRQIAHRFAFGPCLVPLLGAVFVAASRVHDWRHHPWDINAGFIVGSLVSVGMLLRVTATLQQLQSIPAGGSEEGPE